jgi:hypothetical protein
MGSANFHTGLNRNGSSKDHVMADKPNTTFTPSRRYLLAGAALLAAPVPAIAVEKPVNLEAYLGFLQAEVRAVLRTMGKGTRLSTLPICWAPDGPAVAGTVEERARLVLGLPLVDMSAPLQDADRGYVAEGGAA